VHVALRVNVGEVVRDFVMECVELGEDVDVRDGVRDFVCFDGVCD